MLEVINKTLSKVIRQTSENGMLNSGRYRLGLVKATLERAFDSRRELRRFLLISVHEPLYYTSEQQLVPLLRYAAPLRKRFGVVFRLMGIADGLKLSSRSLSEYDAVGLKFGWKWPQSDAERIAATFRERLQGKSTKLVYFDGDDDLCIQWPEVLRSVDIYVKKQVFADYSQYLREFIGKSNLTDYVAGIMDSRSIPISSNDRACSARRT